MRICSENSLLCIRFQVTWFRNDRRVCENSHIRCVNEGNFYCIELTPVSLDDVGRWMCMAENASGRNSCLCVLNVLVPKAYKAPEFVEHLRALLTEEGLVSLECKVIGVPTPLLRYFHLSFIFVTNLSAVLLFNFSILHLHISIDLRIFFFVAVIA